jgi:hypothetical protein
MTPRYRDALMLAALEQACKGRCVYPIRPRTKKPAFVRWQAVATTDAKTIVDWWREAPAYNVGVLLPASVVRVDIDAKNGADGFESLRRLEDLFGELPPTSAFSTPNNGEGRLYRLAQGECLKTGGRFADGVEILGGWTILPPSETPDGVYRWLNDHGVATLPLWVLDARAAYWQQQRRRDAFTVDVSGLERVTLAAEELVARIAAATGRTAFERPPDARGSRRWSFCCPAHDDAHASGYALAFRDGGIYPGCSAGCTPEAICVAIGVHPASLGLRRPGRVA